MAGDSKQQQLSLRVYNGLQTLGCPLVDGLYLRESASMQQLLCTPSLHRMDILKWLCVRICPSLRDKFSTMKSSPKDEVAKEIARFGHEMMLCKAEDQELIKGFATPLRQLFFLDQLLTIAQDNIDTSSNEKSSEDESMRSENLLWEIMSAEHLSDLNQLMNPVFNPWSSHIQEFLRSSQGTRSKPSLSKAKEPNNRSLHQSGVGKPSEDDLAEATALLQSTRSTLEELQKECEFLQSDPSSPRASLSPCALKVAISDMAQLMTAFSQVYNTDFKSYCQRAPSVFSQSTCVFQSVHQLLHLCNKELEALQQLAETSSFMSETITQIKTERRYWVKGEKQTLPNQLEALKNRYTAFLSPH